MTDRMAGWVHGLGVPEPNPSEVAAHVRLDARGIDWRQCGYEPATLISLPLNSPAPNNSPPARALEPTCKPDFFDDPWGWAVIGHTGGITAHCSSPDSRSIRKVAGIAA